MKLLVHECARDDVVAKIKWIESELGLVIHRVRSFYDPYTAVDKTQIIVIAMDKETETMLRLRAGPEVFMDFSS